MLRLLKVSGDILLPVLKNGDFVLIAKIPLLFKFLQRGDMVVFHHNIHGTMIKQVEEISTTGESIMVSGFNQYSVDSALFGSISKEAIIGKVIWHIKRPDST